MTLPASDSPPPTDADRETLLAYLDGELEADARRQLEDRLATDKELRNELALLQKCGDALASLGAEQADGDFLRSTLTLVAMRAVDDAQQAAVTAPLQRQRRWMAWSAAAILAGALGFGLVRYGLGDPTARLTGDLPVLERLDQWRLAGSVECLSAIHEAGLFADEADSVAGVSEASAPVRLVSFDLAQLSQQDQDELLRRRQRWEQLPSDERVRLQALVDQVSASPRSQSLLTTLERYFDWAAADLSPAELDELRKAAAAETPTRIRELIGEHAERRRSSLSPEDQRAVAQWFEQTVRKLAPNVKPPANELQRRAEMRRWLERNRNGFAARFFQRLTPQDIEALVQALSDEAGKRLAEVPRPQWARVIGPWIQAAVREPGGVVSEEEMTAYFEGLPGDERERLMRLPAEEMQQQLRRAYWRDRHGDRPPSAVEGELPPPKGPRARRPTAPPDRGPPDDPIPRHPRPRPAEAKPRLQDGS